VGRSDKLLLRFNGPFRVVRRVSDVNYEVEIRRGAKWVRDTVHVERMKPYFEPGKWRTCVRRRRERGYRVKV
jgi:hypothetical protein